MPIARPAVILAATTVTLMAAAIALAASADAHVTVSAPGAAQGGGDQVITFRVPTESATASTIGLAVKVPTNTPIASILVAPHVGWTSTVTTVQLTTPIQTDDGPVNDAVSTITWKADSLAYGIKPGQFDQFVVIAGQLPNTPSLTFPSVQTYSDGSVVSWIEIAAPGSTVEPDHPAPVLDLASATGSGHGSSAPTVSAKRGAGVASSSSATAGIVLGIVGVLLGATALAVVWVRTRPDRSPG